MSAWMDSVFRTVLSRSTEDVPGQVSASIRRKRLLIAGGIAAGIVALVVGVLVWRYYRGKKGKKTSERRNNPSDSAKRKKRSVKPKEPAIEVRKSHKIEAKPRRRTAKRLKDTTEIQTLIFSKKKFATADEAKEWAKEHDFETTKVDETGQSFRLRQHVPGLYGPRLFRTITVTDGIKGVVARRKAA